MISDARQLAALIDHTVLRATVSFRDIERLCAEAVAYRFGAVCVPPALVAEAAKNLAGTAVRIGTVCGFPLGYSTSRAKAFEAAEAVENGAAEVDMVINLGLVKDRRYGALIDEVREVVRAADPATVKVIIECSELTEAEKRHTVEALLESGAHYVKTATGFGPWGAKERDVRLIKGIIQGRMKLKAAGGIRELGLALGLLEAGADRLGTSSGVLLVESFRKRLAAAEKEHEPPRA
ncbi:MAG: deoxyribose-phosphate aldolase [Pseudomonadota bacterium]